MWRATLANLTAHKLRSAATALAIVLGMALIVGTLVLGDTLNAAFRDLFGQTGAGIDVQVTGVQPFEETFGPPGQTPGVPQEVADTIAEVEGVAAVEPTYQGNATLIDAQGGAVGGQGPPTLGVDAPTVDELATVELRDGRYPRAAGEVAIDAGTAEILGVEVGDTVRVVVDGPAEESEIVGIAGFPGTDNLAGATITVFDDETARERYGQDGASTVDVLAEEDLDQGELRDAIAAEVGADYQVLTGDEAAEQAASDIGVFLGFLTTALLVFGGVSLLVGAFLIFNIFNITVAQRTRELALLRAIGASRRQVLVSVLAEALLIGVAGSVVGLAAGVGAAAALRALLEQFNLSAPEADLVVTARTVVVALVVGPLVTLVAAAVPALRSTRVRPLAALRSVAAPGTGRVGATRLVLGFVVLALGVGGLVAGLFGDAGLPVIGAGATLVLLAVAALSPLVTRPVGRALGAPIAATRGVPGTLARENTVRNTRRTATTAAALMIGLGLVTFVLVFAASLQASVDQVIDDVFVADYQVQPRDFVSFPPEVIDALSETDGVAVGSRVKAATAGIEGDARQLGAIDPETFAQVLRTESFEGDLGGLTDGGIALDSDLAADLGVGLGDTVGVAFTDPDQETPFEVAAIYDSSDLAITVQAMIGLDDFAAVLPGVDDSQGFLLLEDGVDPDAIRPELDAVIQTYPTAQLLDLDELRQQARDQTNQLLSLVFALLFLSVLIALFGIANTLWLSVVERTRELGLLRAVGMSRRQARTMVRWEAVIVSIFGAALGLVVGVFFGWIFTRALEDIGLNVFALPVGQLAAAVVFAGLAGVLAAVVPARRAARVDMLRALAVE